MNNFFKNISYVIIAALVAIIFLMKMCQPTPSTPKPEVITKIEVKYDTISKEITTYVPKVVTRTEWKHDTVTKIDTVKVLNDYYAKYFYSDSINGDSLKLVINDTVSENKIVARSINYSLIYPTVTINKTEIKNKTELYYGLGIGGNKNTITYFGPELLLKTKNKGAYGLGVGLIGPNSPNIQFKFYWKIGKNK